MHIYEIAYSSKSQAKACLGSEEVHDTGCLEVLRLPSLDVEPGLILTVRVGGLEPAEHFGGIQA